MKKLDIKVVTNLLDHFKEYKFIASNEWSEKDTIDKKINTLALLTQKKL